MAIQERFYTVDELATMLKIHRKTVCRLIDKGKLMAVDVGTNKRKMYRIYEGQLRNFLAESYEKHQA